MPMPIKTAEVSPDGVTSIEGSHYEAGTPAFQIALRVLRMLQ